MLSVTCPPCMGGWAPCLLLVLPREMRVGDLRSFVFGFTLFSLGMCNSFLLETVLCLLYVSPWLPSACHWALLLGFGIIGYSFVYLFVLDFKAMASPAALSNSRLSSLPHPPHLWAWRWGRSLPCSSSLLL